MGNAGRCNPEIFNNGIFVFVTHTMSAEKIDRWVKAVAILSGQPVDWHYVAGRAVVKTTGDVDIVRETMHALRQFHDDWLLEALQSIKIPHHPKERDEQTVREVWRYSMSHQSE